MRRALAAAAAALLLGAAGCADDTPTGAPGTAPATATAPSGPTDLAVVWWPQGPGAEEGRTELTVTCPARPAATDTACGDLVAMAGEDVFAATPPAGMMCTQQYGGPETLEVEGQLAGRPVKTTFTRVDGCQIARWDRAAPVLLELGRR